MERVWELPVFELTIDTYRRPHNDDGLKKLKRLYSLSRDTKQNPISRGLVKMEVNSPSRSARLPLLTSGGVDIEGECSVVLLGTTHQQSRLSCHIHS